MKSLLLKPEKSPRENGLLLEITPDQAGWKTISLRLVRLERAQTHIHSQPGDEIVLVMLGGRAAVTAAGQRTSLGRRTDVFSGMPHALYLPVGLTDVAIEGLTETCEVAICGARASKSYPARLIEPSQVEIEVRGGGNATRQINHIVKPEFPADRILIVEVYTPSGNWSSYPPHKHDVHSPPDEVDLDEIYFYKISRPDGYAIQRVYRRDGTRNETITVHNNEAILVPDGYHPVVAAHGYDCYYLNVLAGSARSMAATDDPEHAWIRRTWNTQDPRVPLVQLDGGGDGESPSR